MIMLLSVSVLTLAQNALEMTAVIQHALGYGFHRQAFETSHDTRTCTEMKGLQQLAAVFWLLDRTHAVQDDTIHTVSMVIFTVLGYKGCSVAIHMLEDTVSSKTLTCW